MIDDRCPRVAFACLRWISERNGKESPAAGHGPEYPLTPAVCPKFGQRQLFEIAKALSRPTAVGYEFLL